MGNGVILHIFFKTVNVPHYAHLCVNTQRVWFWRTKFSPHTSSWNAIFPKLLDRRLRPGEAWESWVSRRQSVSKSTFPCQKRNCACVLCIGSTFSKCRYCAAWTKGKSDLSPWRGRKKSLKRLNASLTSAASGPLTLAATCTFETSALNFRALFPDGFAVFCAVWQRFCWLVMILNKGNMKKVHIFQLFFHSMCIF